MSSNAQRLKKVGIIWVQDSINAGDDVQTLAMHKLVKRLDPVAEVVWLDREQLHLENTDNLTHLIVSGWFMKKPQHWPLHPSLPKPLFISFHISREQGVDQFLQSPQYQSFWKKHQPVGCRDRGTRQGFEKLGIDAWFSGCATLTYAPRARSNSEPYGLIADPFYFLRSPAYDAHQLRRVFGKQPSISLKHVTNADPTRPRKTQAVRLQETQELISLIANAEFVFTSRIHIALPATAMGVPVYFVTAGYDRTKHSTDRFDGLLELFHIIDGTHFGHTSRKRWGKLLRLLKFYKTENRSLAHLMPEQHVPVPNDTARNLAQGIEQTITNYLKAGAFTT